MEDTSAPLPCVAREETLRDQFPDHRKIGRACRCWLSVQQLGQRVEDLAHGQLTVTGTQQRRLHGVSRAGAAQATLRSEEHTSELQSLMRISYAVFCLKKQNKKKQSTKEK